MISALYRGEVTHRRLRPREHRLRYRVFWLLLDLAELDAADATLRLFSRNRFNLLSFHDRDYGDGSEAGLRDQIVRALERHGVRIESGAIRLLTMPRVLGYVFNPISVYYCHFPDGGLAAVVYEVTSTFRERRAYVLPVRPSDSRRGLIRHSADKALHVSPFMGMDMRYEFRGHAPDDLVDLAIDGLDSEGLLIATALRGDRRALTDGAILRAVAAIPFLTAKVIAAIHWEALKLWLKATPVFPAPRQSPPQDAPGLGDQPNGGLRR